MEVETRSGYGDHSRDLITSLIEMDMFDIKIKSVKWGNTMTGLRAVKKRPHGNRKRLYWNRFLNTQPDVMIHIGVPNEFQNWGKFNVGITAGIETTQCSGDWLQGLTKWTWLLFHLNTQKMYLKKRCLNRKMKVLDKR